jgi:hypothetical protein
MLGEFHCATGSTLGTGGGVVSAFFVIVTTALVSDGTALKETLPEKNFALSPVIDPLKEEDELYV